MKINVVGTSGSGKSTVAQLISDRLNIPYLEMDEFYWLPEWQERSQAEFQNLLSDALNQDNWVLAGNYHGKMWKWLSGWIFRLPERYIKQLRVQFIGLLLGKSCVLVM